MNVEKFILGIIKGLHMVRFLVQNKGGNGSGLLIKCCFDIVITVLP